METRHRPQTTDAEPTAYTHSEDPYPWWSERPIMGLRQLQSAISEADSLDDWATILNAHISWGNTKIADHVGTYSMNAATDCPNIETEYCQVDADECYAARTEHTYDETLAYRRRQEYLWDHLDAQTFAMALTVIAERKRNHPFNADKRQVVSALRFNQAGDIRHRGDVVKVDRIAELVNKALGIDVYLYTASSWVRWDELPTAHVTINASNQQEPLASVADRFYTALPDGTDPADVDWLDDDAIHCPYQASDGQYECGECKVCVTDDAPDAYIRIH